MALLLNHIHPTCLIYLLISALAPSNVEKNKKTPPTRRHGKTHFQGRQMCLDIMATSGRQYGGLQTSKSRNSTNIKQSDASSKPDRNTKKINKVSCRAAFLPVHLVRLLSFNSLLFCASLHVHSGVFTFSQSVVGCCFFI